MMTFGNSFLFFIFLITIAYMSEIKGNTSTTTVKPKGTTDDKNAGEESTTENSTTSVMYETTCSENGSCSITNSFESITQPPSHTKSYRNTTKAIFTTTAIPPKTGGPESMDKVTGFCSCDLHVNYCDLNCCCDKDCNYEDKLIFGYCRETIKKSDDFAMCDSNYTFNRDDISYEMQIFSNSFLCIKATNLPPKYHIRKRRDMKEISDFAAYKRAQYSWPLLEETDGDYIKPNFSERPKFGTNTWIFKNDEVVPFTLPAALITNQCITNKQVQYLVNYGEKCSNPIVEDENESLHAETYYKNITFISSLKAFRTLWDKKKQKKCPKDICITPEVRFCNSYFENCKNISDNSTKSSCSYNFHDNSLVCLNAAKKIRYVIYHKGLEGILKVELKIVLQNLTFFVRIETFEFPQEFEASFRWYNYKTNYSALLSGNPGYFMGKPILIAHVNNTNGTRNSTETNMQTILRNDTVFIENFFVLPSDKRSYCLLNEHEYTVVEFEYNMILKCVIREELMLKNYSKSPTETCKIIQKRLLQYWLLDDKNRTLVFGKYGSSDRRKLSDWYQVLFAKNYTQILNETYGNFTDNNRTLVCGNLVVRLRVNIFHARVDLSDAENQEKIVGVSYNFTQRGKFEFPFAVNKSVNFSIPSITEVAFFDVTSHDTEKFADPPSLEVKLPYDFFYPFIKMESSSGKFEINNIVIILFVMVAL